MIVVLAIVEVVFEPATDQELEIWRDGHVAAIEERVDVGPKKKSVFYSMVPAFAHWFNVRRFQHWQHFLARDRTPALIGVSNQPAKGALSHSGYDKGRFTM